jgi:hypothetical protein
MTKEQALQQLIDFQENLERLLDNVNSRVNRFDEEDVDAIESTRFNQMFQMIEYNQHID